MMAAQVEMESGMVGSRLRLSPLTDSSNKALMEDPTIIDSEPKKPVLGPKPRLTPKPFSVERNTTLRPVLAPKPQPKPKPDSLSKPDPPSKPKTTSAVLQPGGKATFGKPTASSVKPEPSAANEPSKPESTSVVRRTSLGSSAAPGSSRNTNITRAKSMGLLNRTGIEEEGRKDGEVVLRSRDGGASRPRPVSAFIPSDTPSQPAARCTDRRPLSSDLTSKFESSQRNPPTGESKENTPEEQEEAESVLKELDKQDAKPLEKAGSGIKRRISLLIDSSSSSYSLPASRGAEPRSPVAPIPDTDGAVGVKQRIKELTEDMSTAPSPSIKLQAKPRPLPVDLTKRFASEVESLSSAEPKGLQEGVEDLSWKSRDLPPTGQSKTPEERKWQDVQDSTQVISPMDVQTVRASLFENVVEKRSIQMLDTGSSGGPGKTVPKRSVSLRLKADFRPASPEDEDDGSWALATYQKVASPTDPRRVDHVFDTLAAVEESRAVSESVPAAYLEEKALTLRSRRSEVGERPQQTNLTSGATLKELSSSTGESRNLLKDKDGPSRESGTEKSSPRFLRVGALPKWEDSYVDRESELEREKQREMVRKMKEELQRQMEVQLAAKAELEEEEEFEAKWKKQASESVTRPRATYFALTGQMNETVYQSAALNTEIKSEEKTKSELQFDDFSVKAGRRSVSNRATSVRRKLPQEAVYSNAPLEEPSRTEHPDRVWEYSRANEEQWLKEQQRAVEYEKMMELEKQRELTKQRDLERERQIEAEKERTRVMEEQLEKERQRLAEFERLRELERQRELQKVKELERERQKELERQREMERWQELERQRELERQQLLEKERQKQLEYERGKAAEKELEQQREAERQRQKEFERERERMLDQERLRLREFEKQRERERQLELDRQMETDRQKQMALERQRESERLKELERQREAERQRELERQKQKELERQRELEREKQKAEERENQKAQEELKRIQEIERRQLLEYQLQRENERTKAAEDLQRSAEKGRRTAESPLRPKVLDLDSVFLGDRVAPGGDRSSTPKSVEPYRSSILDVDSFRNQAQPGAVLDAFAMPAFSAPDFGGAPPRESRSVSSLHPQMVLQNLRDHQRDPSPQMRVAEPAQLPAPLQPQVLHQPQALHQPQPQAPPSDRQATGTDWALRGRPSGSTWATSQFDMWDVSHEEMAVDEPLWVASAKDSRRSINTRHPSLERLLLNQEERGTAGMSPTSASGLVSSPGGILTPERVWSTPTKGGPAGNLPTASSRKEPQTVASPSVPEPSWSPVQDFDPWNKGSSDSSRLRSRSVSQRFAVAESSVDGPLARLRSRSAHRERGQDSREQLRPSVSGQDGNKDTDTLVQETDSQYGTWDTGLRTDESLTPATPSSESNFTPSPRKPSPPQTPEQPSSTTTTPSSEDQPDALSFIQSPTTLLDSSAQRSRVQLSKSCRRRRAPPSRAARHSAVLSEGLDFSSEEWRFKDSTEDKPDSGKQQDDESDEEEPVRESRPSTASSQPQRVSLFPGMDPSALMAQLKKRNEAEGQSDAVSPSQLSRSPKSPFLPRASRVLPPPGGKENGEESPAWLKELKTKKRFSQIENDS